LLKEKLKLTFSIEHKNGRDLIAIRNATNINDNYWQPGQDFAFCSRSLHACWTCRAEMWERRSPARNWSKSEKERERASEQSAD